MKVLFTLALITVSMGVIAQPKNKIYLFDGSIEDLHFLLVEYPGTNISIHGGGSGTDTSAAYRGDHSQTAFFSLTGTIANRTFTVTFDKSVDFCVISCEKGICHLTTTHNPAKTAYQFFIGELKANEFSFNVYSKERVFAQMKEVSKYIR